MDIVSVVHRNYQLASMQIAHWRDVMEGDNRLLLCDNTPPQERQHLSHKYIWYARSKGIDGESHGGALDYLVRQTQTPMIGLVDTDFFWLNPKIVAYAEAAWEQGFKCVGCAGYYPDWVEVIDLHVPERHGSLAPVIWGMFIDRELALKDTFVSTKEEAAQIAETGWRHRKRIIEEGMAVIVFPGFNDSEDPEMCYFGPKDRPQGVHLLKGSSARCGLTSKLVPIIEHNVGLWKKAHS